MVNVNSSKCIPHSSWFCVPQSWPLHIILNKAHNLVVGSKYPFKSRTWLFPLAFTQSVPLENLIILGAPSRANVLAGISAYLSTCALAVSFWHSRNSKHEAFSACKSTCKTLLRSDHVLATPLPQRTKYYIYIHPFVHMYASLNNHLLWLFLVQQFHTGHCAHKVLIAPVRNQSSLLKDRAPKARTSFKSYHWTIVKGLNYLELLEVWENLGNMPK